MTSPVMDHYRNPRNTTDLSFLDESRQYENPSCGDWIRVRISANNTCIEKIEFQAEGCSLCIAAASMMTEFLKGKTREVAVSLAQSFIQAIENTDSGFDTELWGELACFEEIRRFPVRQRCVILPFRAFLRELPIRESGHNS